MGKKEKIPLRTAERLKCQRKMTIYRELLSKQKKREEHLALRRIQKSMQLDTLKTLEIGPGPSIYYIILEHLIRTRD